MARGLLLLQPSPSSERAPSLSTSSMPTPSALVKRSWREKNFSQLFALYRCTSPVLVNRTCTRLSPTQSTATTIPFPRVGWTIRIPTQMLNVCHQSPLSPTRQPAEVAGMFTIVACPCDLPPRVVLLRPRAARFPVLRDAETPLRDAAAAHAAVTAEPPLSIRVGIVAERPPPSRRDELLRIASRSATKTPSVPRRTSVPPPPRSSSRLQRSASVESAHGPRCDACDASTISSSQCAAAPLRRRRS